MRRTSMANDQHCYNCYKVISKNQQSAKHECPTVNPTTDVITTDLHIMCKNCVHLFTNIKNYALKNKLSYANHKFRLESIIDQSIIKLSELRTQDNLKVTLCESPTKLRHNGQSKSKSNQKSQSNQSGQVNSNKQQIYGMILEQTVIQKRLNYAIWLPKSLQYLIYLTSKNMRCEQRHQRIKKIIFLVSRIYSVQLKQLKALVVFLQTLLCHMDQNILLGVVDRILKVYIKNHIPFELLIHQLNSQTEVKKHKSQTEKIQSKQMWAKDQKNQNQKKFRPDFVLYISLSVIILSDFVKQKKLINQVQGIYQISMKSLKLNVSQKATQSEIQNYIKQKAKNNQKSGKINEQGWIQLLQLRKVQNNYFLILDTVKSQHLANQQYISQIQLKFKKEKEEYINKIIRLNNKIEQLNIQLQKHRQKQQNQLQYKQKIEENKNFNQKTNKSNPQVNQLINKQEIPQLLINRINHSISTSNLQMETQILQKSLKTTKSMVAETYEEEKSVNLINNLQSILTITDILQINKKYQKSRALTNSVSFQLPTSPDDLSSLIISQIAKMQKNLMKLKNQGKKNKQQTNRIMSILKRKQQQWLPLFHQKDELISKYQDALLKLQNGKITQEQPLAARFKYIASKWSTCNKCAQELLKAENQRSSNADDNRNSIVQDRSSFIQTGSGQKQKKKKQKDCIIY